MTGGVDLNGDERRIRSCTWPGSGAAQNALAAREVAITDTTAPGATYVAAIDDTGIVRSHALSGGGWTPVPDMLPGTGLKACGAVFAFFTREAAVGNDLNNDGDQLDDNILVILDPATNTIATTQLAAHDFVCNPYVSRSAPKRRQRRPAAQASATGFSGNVLQAYDLHPARMPSRSTRSTASSTAPTQ